MARPTTLDTTQLARWFDCTPRHIQRLTVEGVLTRARDEEGNEVRGRYEVAATVFAYVRYLKTLAKVDDASETEYQRLRNAKMAAEAAVATIKLKELKGEMLRAGDVDFLLTNLITATKQHLLSIASRVTRTLVPFVAAETGNANFQKIFDAVNAEVERGLRELSEWKPGMFGQEIAGYLMEQGYDESSLNGESEDEGDEGYDDDEEMAGGIE